MGVTISDPKSRAVEQERPSKPSGPTDAAWMIALLLVFMVAVGYFFLNVIQFHLLPH